MRAEDLTEEILAQCRNMAELYGRAERKKISKAAEPVKRDSAEEKTMRQKKVKTVKQEV